MSNSTKRPKLPIFDACALAPRTASFDDAGPPLGIRLEVSATGGVQRLSGRPSFVLPLQRSVLGCQLAGLPSDQLLDASSWLLVPRGQTVRLETFSFAARTLVLEPHSALLHATVTAYVSQIEPEPLKRSLESVYVAPRTTWVSEIAQRYLFERSVCNKRDNAATTFIEVELLKEWFFVRRDHEARARARPSHIERDAPLLERAQSWIDAHLAESITVAALSLAMRASPSAVLRAFHQGLGLAPGAYLRARRLDEAILLLRSGRYSVGEVAASVGYGSFAAFSHSFRARFGVSPSGVLPCAAQVPVHGGA